MYAKTLIFAVEILESSFATKDNEPPKQTGNRTYLGGISHFISIRKNFLFHVINHKNKFLPLKCYL